MKSTIKLTLHGPAARPRTCHGDCQGNVISGHAINGAEKSQSVVNVWFDTGPGPTRRLASNLNREGRAVTIHLIKRGGPRPQQHKSSRLLRERHSGPHLKGPRVRLRCKSNFRLRCKSNFRAGATPPRGPGRELSRLSSPQAGISHIMGLSVLRTEKTITRRM